MIKYIHRLKPGVLALYLIKVLITIVKPLVLLIFPKLILDEIATRGDFTRILYLSVIMVVVTFVLNSLYNIVQNIWSHYYNILSAVMGCEHLRSNVECKYEYIEDKEYLNLQQRVRDNVMPTDYMYFISSLIENIILIFTYSYIIFVFDFKLLIGIILYSVVSFLINKKINKEEYQYSQKISPISRVINYFYRLSSDPSYGKDIRIDDLGNLIRKKIEKAHFQKIDAASSHAKKILSFNLLLLLCSFFWEAFLYFMVTIAALAGAITIGSFSLYIGVMSNFIEQVSAFFKGLDNFRYWNERISYLKKYNSIASKRASGSLSTKDLGPIEIEFRNVWFRYPNGKDYVLRGIDLEIKSGEKLAVVGKNGAGKSTFIKLLCRLYEPTKGDILINGKSIQSYDVAEYADLLTTVLQDFKLFAYSVSENVILQNEYNAEKLDKALQKADIFDKIGRLKNGIHTIVTKEFDDEGVDFSGGERQKIAIARAIYRNSKIFILDEPNSAMDPISESKFYENFRSITKDKTTIYISHRLASTKFCDHIAVFDGGKIVEYGSHEMLIKNNGEYAELFQKQSSGYVYGVD